MKRLPASGSVIRHRPSIEVEYRQYMSV